MSTSWEKTALSKPLKEQGVCGGLAQHRPGVPARHVALRSLSATYRVSAESGTVSNLT